MNININSKFQIREDSNNYIVEEIGEIQGKNKDTGEMEGRIGIIKTTYHPSLEYAFRHVIRQAPKVENVTELKDIIRVINSVEKSIKDIKIKEKPKKDYKGIKGVLNQITQYCDEYVCDESCPMYLRCEPENWDLLKEDLKDLGIDKEECGIRN